MKKYWKSIDERDNSPEFTRQSIESEILHKEEIIGFLEKGGEGITPSRRDFLKFFGFSFATAAVVSSCKNPVNKAIPYLVKPDDVFPGEATNYATAFFDGRDFSSLVAKVRDGRPIKLEGNEKCPLTKGGSHARIQASLLNLYDDATRIRKPMKDGRDSDWNTVDGEITGLLKEISASGGKTVLLTGTVISPSLLSAIQSFLSRYPGSIHVSYDAISLHAIREAHRLFIGIPAIPAFRFDKATVIAGFNCDFLGTWLSPVEFTRQYAETRKLGNGKESMSHHVQYETTLTLTGSNADKRIAIKPSEEKAALINLYAELAKLAGQPAPEKRALPFDMAALAAELWSNRVTSLVVSGTNDVSVQLIVCAINDLLGNYGNTITPEDHFNTGRGDDKAMTELVNDLQAGRIQGLILHNVNPAYTWPEAASFTEGLKKLKLCVSTATAKDETVPHCRYVCPDHHFLESWGDAEPRKNLFMLAQPAIRPLFSTRHFLESLLTWTEAPSDAYRYITAWWKQNIFPGQSAALSFKEFWVNTLRQGYIMLPVQPLPVNKNLAAAAAGFTAGNNQPAPGTEIILYESIALGDGRYANNPWLQELPDPVSKVTWDNYAALSPAAANAMGLQQGEMIKVKEGLELPVLIQPGQATGTLGIALGYGRTEAGIAGSHIGKNAFPLVSIIDGTLTYAAVASPVKVAGKHDFAQTQMHHNMEGRPIIRETTLPEYKADPASGNESHAEVEKHRTTLYPPIEFPLHDWALAVDLNACTGCSACVVACQAENNIPVIGKDEVARKRIMHWIRIDRYYSDDGENPQVAFQPLMCQHCDNAPCENVCPVAATTHSVEGLNQMAYNRCIGTKYCINNCPYKVRRFNWFRYIDNPAFAYGSETQLGRMVFNPDVTVRERGVVEKCSFCIQRIQAGKLTAKKEGRALADGDVVPACVQACPAKAMVFGDMNDPESAVSKFFKDPRNYHLLEELHTLPSIGYLTKVRNQPAPEGHEDEKHS